MLKKIKKKLLLKCSILKRIFVQSIKSFQRSILDKNQSYPWITNILFNKAFFFFLYLKTPLKKITLLFVDQKRYLAEIGKILLNGNEEETRLCVENDVSKRLIESFVKSEETIIILQKQTISEESRSAEGGNSSSSVNVSVNGNANANANKNMDILVKYQKKHDSIRKMTLRTNIITSGRNQLNSQSPLGYMLPYIRHSFVPTSIGLAQLEEQKQRGANANIGSSGSGNDRSGQILDKLREFEMKLIESQNESLLSGVALDLVKGVQECIDLCSE
ncbi:hypothetical protein RFI_05544 [Reticulomyxa filosa]|uniref:Uncharacterized protein n=1 Tax=Reticulomyxa filosa TaxID=46433 RepID=X6NZZ9_RETFI|nr:hypothetical protein RFI_05544 [Reticulomyxa filosa]|eukprot:ETO31576.1 hypothetical protein RFI_05544 [Reticulomyxa filosa]